MDVLRPALVRVGNRVYRKNPILQKGGDYQAEDHQRGTAFGKTQCYIFFPRSFASLYSATLTLMPRFFIYKSSNFTICFV